MITSVTEVCAESMAIGVTEAVTRICGEYTTVTNRVCVDFSVLVVTEVAVIVALTAAVGTAAVEVAVSVSVDVPTPPDGVTVDALKLPVIPVGNPVTAKLTFPVNDPPVRMVTTSVAVAPWTTETLAVLPPPKLIVAGLLVTPSAKVVVPVKVAWLESVAVA